MFLLDTNVLSEIRKFDEERGDHHVRMWSYSSLRQSSISVLSLFELRQGVRKLELRNDFVQARVYQSWIETKVVPYYFNRILPVTQTIAEAGGLLYHPDPVSEVDRLLAATAMTHDLTLVTRNVQHFRASEEAGLRVLNPWTPRLHLL